MHQQLILVLNQNSILLIGEDAPAANLVLNQNSILLIGEDAPVANLVMNQI